MIKFIEGKLSIRFIEGKLSIRFIEDEWFKLSIRFIENEWFRLLKDDWLNLLKVNDSNYPWDLLKMND